MKESYYLDLTPIKAFSNKNYISIIKSSDPNILLATNGSTLYRSYDRAETWKDIKWVTNHGWWQQIVSSPKDSHEFAAVNNDRLLKSFDDGEHWEQVKTSCPLVIKDKQNHKITSIISYLGKRNRLAFNSHSNGEGLFLSEDGGLTCHETNLKGNYWQITSSEGSNHIFAINSWDGVMARSDNGGELWRTLNFKGAGVPLMLAFPFKRYHLNNAIYFTMINRDFKYGNSSLISSYDGGETWSRLKTDSVQPLTIFPFHSYLSSLGFIAWDVKSNFHVLKKVRGKEEFKKMPLKFISESGEPVSLTNFRGFRFTAINTQHTEGILLLVLHDNPDAIDGNGYHYFKYRLRRSVT
ncbi:hypothetical protein L2734_05165 [Parashewanella spongiae]|nr:hypothetical protein [Parashewanella spongiae]MCL1077569.1 hypothetical protein [Parashewanella spongiae]